MSSTDEKIIGVGRTKVALLILGACAFVAAGAWLLTCDDAAIRSGRSFRVFFNDPLIARGFGLASIVFFGLAGLYGLKKLFDRKPALIFNEHGLFDNASAVSAGFIPWSEVTGTAVFEVNKQKTLIIAVRNPQQYIERGGALKRALNKANYRMVGSPISISAGTLEINFSELVSLFDRYQRKYGVRPEGDDAWDDADYVEPDAGLAARLLDWSPGAVKATLGAGGLGILVLLASSLDMLFQIKIPFWVAFAVSMLPVLIFFVAVPDSLPPRVVRPAQWFAVVWYTVLSALSVALAAFRGITTPDAILVVFVVLGLWPCLVAVRRLRAADGT
jgi:hypothetical protein